MPEYMIGIDLGTTNSVVAYWDEDRPQVYEDLGMQQNDPLLPSAVAYDELGNWLVGQPALEQWEVNPEGTVVSVKRQMLHPDRVVKNLGGRDMTPVDISAEILKVIKRKIENIVRNETKITAAVISVPYRYHGHEIEATIAAGKKAGLPVIGTIHEPTAAALAYAKEHSAELRINDKLFVFDLGGGTLDITIFKVNQVSQEKTVFEVIGTGGERELGGDDFDKRVIDHIVKWYRSKCGIDIHEISTYPEYLELKKNGQWIAGEDDKRLKRTQAQLLVEIRKLARKSKEKLASAVSTPIMKVTGLGPPINFILDRATFENELAADLKARLRESIRETLANGNLPPKDMTRIILVGGSSRLFFLAGYKDAKGKEVRGLIEEIFGKKPYLDREVHTAIARGAAYKVAIDQGATKGDIELIETLPFDIGLGLEDENGKAPEEFLVLLKKGERYGASRSGNFGFATEGVDQFNLLIYEGKGPALPKQSAEYGYEVQTMTPATHYRRGALVVNGFKRLAAKECGLTITLATDARDKSLHIVVTEKSTPGWAFRHKLEYGKTFQSTIA